jgi:hypothetical protein
LMHWSAKSTMAGVLPELRARRMQSECMLRRQREEKQTIWRVKLPVFADKRVLDPEAWM